MPKLRVALAVVNDLNFDQRMARITQSLQDAGFDACLIGRMMKGSGPLKNKSYKQLRFNHPFSSGKLFYLWHNFRLFWHYLYQRYDIIVANDLDTMAAGYFASKILRVPLVYDAHEYFPELPEIIARPFTHKVWQFLESFTVPRLNYYYTVSQSYADIFERKYGAVFGIVRNATVLQEKLEPAQHARPYILYQGAVNVGRGVEEMIEAMPSLPLNLIICGKGDVLEQCKERVAELGLQNQVLFRGFVDPVALRSITSGAYLGFTLFSDEGASYYYSLANRFFDYMHAEVPQLAINFPEYRAINEQCEIACLIDHLSSEAIVEAVNKLLANDEYYAELKSNCKQAREIYNWQAQEKELLHIYRKLVEEHYPDRLKLLAE